MASREKAVDVMNRLVALRKTEKVQQCIATFAGKIISVKEANDKYRKGERVSLSGYVW